MVYLSFLSILLGKHLVIDHISEIYWWWLYYFAMKDYRFLRFINCKKGNSTHGFVQQWVILARILLMKHVKFHSPVFFLFFSLIRLMQKSKLSRRLWLLYIEKHCSQAVLTVCPCSWWTLPHPCFWLTSPFKMLLQYPFMTLSPVSTIGWNAPILFWAFLNCPSVLSGWSRHFWRHTSTSELVLI